MYRSVLRDVHVEGELDVLDGTSEPPAGSGGDVLCPRFRCFQLGEMVEILDNYLADAMLRARSVVDPPCFELDDHPTECGSPPGFASSNP